LHSIVIGVALRLRLLLMAYYLY